jgi:hypothetical protein
MHLADSFCPIWLVTQLWISLLFTSRQKQNGFLFRSGCKQANFCIKWNYCFAKNEESHVFQSWVILCVEVFFKAISHGLNKITKSFKYSLYYLVYNYYWSCNIKSFKFSFCLLWYILKQLFTSVSVNSARINQHFNPWLSPISGLSWQRLLHRHTKSSARHNQRLLATGLLAEIIYDCFVE